MKCHIEGFENLLTESFKNQPWAEALDIRIQIYGPEHPSVITIQREGGLIYQQAGLIDEANEMIRQSQELTARPLLERGHSALLEVVGSDHRYMGRVASQLTVIQANPEKFTQLMRLSSQSCRFYLHGRRKIDWQRARINKHR